MSESDQRASRMAEFRRGVLSASSGSIVSIIALFGETLLSARLLTTGQFGSYVLLITIVNFLSLLVDLGIKTTITRMLAANEAAEQAALVSSVVLLRLASIGAISALVWLSRALLLQLDPTIEPFLMFVPLMLLGASLDELLLSVLQGMRAYKHMAIAQILRSCLRLGLSALLLVGLQQGVIGLIISWLVSFLVSVAYQWLALPLALRLVWDQRQLRAVLRFGVPLYLTYFLSFAVQRADVMLLASIAGPTAVAFYAVATRIPDALDRLAGSFIAVFFPTMSAMIGRGHTGEAGQLLTSSLRLVSFATAAIALVGVLFNQEILALVFSQRYLESGPAFAALMIGFHVIFTLNLMGYTLTAAGQPTRSFGVSLLQAAANIAGNLLLIRPLSFIGAALADMLSSYAASWLGMWFLRRSAIPVSVGPHVRQTLLLFGCAGLFWWIGLTGALERAGLLAAFVAGSLMLSTVTWRDLLLVLPQRARRGQPIADLDGTSA